MSTGPNRTVEDLISEPIITTPPEATVREAAAMMTNFGIKHLPVVDADNDYVGIVSSTDITMALA